MTGLVVKFRRVPKSSAKIFDLCRLSTGAGNVQRQFYTRQGQVRFAQISRPMVLNGIVEFVTAPDLLDRSIILHLRYLKNRRTESDLWRDFERKRSRIFGGLMDLMLQGIRNLPSVLLANPARMADFVQWCVACGLQDFEERYQQSLVDNTLALIEHDELAKGVHAVIEKRKEPWEGNIAELARLLREYGYQAPVNPRALSLELRRIMPALRSGRDRCGIFDTAEQHEANTDLTNPKRLVTLRHLRHLLGDGVTQVTQIPRRNPLKIS